MPYGKRHISRTKLVHRLQYYLRRKLIFTAIFLALRVLTNHFDAFFNPKTPQRRTLHITLRQLEKRTSSRATDRCHLTMNFGDNANQSHSNRYQPLTDRKERATQRSFTSRMTKIQAQLKRDSNPTRRTFS